jgi:parallel beta-helix repeat protein
VATSGDVTTTGSTFSGNQATGGNGGGLNVLSAVATVTVDGTAFDQNHASQWGGAIEQESGGKAGAAAAGQFNLTVTNSTITGNTADSDGGGGIDIEDPAEITIDHSTLSGNTGGVGGAVGTFGSSTSLHASASTFNGNTSRAEGGAVQMSGTAEAAAVGDSAADFTNSTITGNTEASFGAIAVTGVVQLGYVTLVGNTSLGEAEPESAASSGRDGVSAQAVEGDAANVAAFTLTSYASVVAQPQGAANCVAFEAPTDSGYSFSDDTSCGFTAATSKVTPNAPLLGALANNGGPTQTLLPQAGSPLLDVVPPAACVLTLDQRGITRPQGTGCDIGAVEVQAAPAAAPAAVATPRFTG